jgi:hypothetical protein
LTIFTQRRKSRSQFFFLKNSFSNLDSHKLYIVCYLNNLI